MSYFQVAYHALIWQKWTHLLETTETMKQQSGPPLISSSIVSGTNDREFIPRIINSPSHKKKWCLCHHKRLVHGHLKFICMKPWWRLSSNVIGVFGVILSMIWKLLISKKFIMTLFEICILNDYIYISDFNIVDWLCACTSLNFCYFICLSFVNISPLFCVHN